MNEERMIQEAVVGELRYKTSMRSLPLVALLTISSAFAIYGASFSADSKRGALIFASQMCTNCHSVLGRGANTAPDLGRRLDRNYTPAGIASLMWNHAPAMWSAIAKQGIPMPQLTETDSADLFAYFYAAHFFEKPGEAERGKALFASKRCADCHALTADTAKAGPPVSQWAALSDPTVLVTQMFDHAAQMNRAMRERNIPWPQLTPLDLTDLLVYLQNLPQMRSATLEFQMPAPQGGQELFRGKGCVNCHTNERAFENLIGDSTLTDIAAAMWNHAPLMVKSAETAPEQIKAPEMRQILSFVWASQFFSPKGDAARGKHVFESKKCESCHNNSASGAPALTQANGAFSAVRMVAVLWSHGPTMLERMKQQNIAWPKLSPSEMTNLVAYLNSR
jgi:cytochrome c2